MAFMAARCGGYGSRSMIGRLKDAYLLLTAPDLSPIAPYHPRK